jgi:Domain of unknown function (DUF5916)/Carbohydrate family 9 binding domain-like
MTMRARRLAQLPLFLGAYLGLAAQVLQAQFNPPQAPAPRKSYTAVRVNPHAPVIDGKLDDPVWAGGGWENGFVQSRPYEGREPSQKTEFKIVYDDRAIYVAVRALDTRPAEIERRISRRDNCNGDSVSVAIDSLFDHLTAYVFSVNACGVKADQMVVNGGMDYRDERDMSWDPIWDAEAAIDSRGWTAEMRIPFSQLRFGNKDQQVWGLQVSRYLFRLSEGSEWQPIPRSAPGYVHLYGELRGLQGLASPHQLEITPYTVGRLETYPAVPGNPFATGHDQSLVGGVDGKIGVTSDLTLNFTAYPDFGQVEADPSVVNLTAYETFYEEKRPFFVEGRNILDYPLVGGEGDYSADNLFYSRRIGRNPHYEPTTAAYLEMPGATSILGAFKLTGKTRSGLSIGVLDGLTARENALVSDGGDAYRVPIEPLTNYFVARAQQDYNRGATTLGGMLTSVKRDLRDANLSFLHDSAVTGGVDFFHSWKNKTYFFALKAVSSRVHGSPEAILETQISSVHYFQRPDADYVTVDPHRTSLSGTGGSVEVGKQGGGPWQYVAGFSWRSPGLELNDVGFLRSSDQMTEYVWAGYSVYEPVGIFRNYSINLSQRAGWNFGGDTTSNGVSLSSYGQFKNYWSAGLGLSFNAESLSQGALRGGPSLRLAAARNLWLSVQTDSRRKIRLSLSASGGQRPNGDSEYWSVRPALNIVPSAAMTLSLGPMFSANRNILQYVETPIYDTENRYIFGDIDQTTFGLTIRLNYSLTPDLSIQLYAMPFVSAGAYSAFKRITNSRSKDLDARYYTFGPDELAYDPLAQVYAVDENRDGTADYTFTNPEFNFRELRSNLVVRWEYLPGSTLYLVWSQGRTGSVTDGAFHLPGDLGELLNVQPDNTFLVKFSYCFQL